MTQGEFEKVLNIKENADAIVQEAAEKLAHEAVECLSRLIVLGIPVVELYSHDARRMTSIEYDPENVRLVYDVVFDD